MTHVDPLQQLAVLDVDQVAKRLRCAPKTVQERARTGDLPGIKFGDDWVFPAGALARRLDELALEQAAARRKPADPAGVVTPIRPAKAPRRPPALPRLP